MHPVNKESMDSKIDNIIKLYNRSVGNVESIAQTSTKRAYGGIIRAEKGELVEEIARQLVTIAWVDYLGQNPRRLSMNKTKLPIGITEKYELNIENLEIKKWIHNNKNKLIYKFGTDVHVYIDDKLCLPIECKAFAENAMIKRILFDASLMKEATGVKNYYLLQLESQLGGDYSELNEISYGSPSTHALMSHVPEINLEIITLLKGERKIDRPIHKPEFFKPLEKTSLEIAVKKIALGLEDNISTR